MKENIGFYVFLFFVAVFVLLLIGGKILNSARDAKRKAKKAAEAKAQKYKDETGRQQTQYYYNPKASATNQSATHATQAEQPQKETEEIRTKTATGETIIDRRSKERENKKKIYEQTEGEYVEFSEEA